MNELVHIFVKMAQAGIQAGAAVLAVLLFRRLFLEKQPKNFCCVLWLLVFLRFLCPVTWNVVLPFDGEKMRTVDISENVMLLEQAAVGMDMADSGNAALMDGQGTAETADAVLTGNRTAGDAKAQNGKAVQIAETHGDNSFEGGSRRTESTEALSKIRTWFQQPANRWLLLQGVVLVWPAGAVLLLLFAMARYLRLRRRLRFAVKCEFFGQEIWETDQIEGPFVMGVFRPGIYLPTGLPEQEKYHIIIHERAHLARRDYLVKLICYLGVIVQWMNPFAWIAFYFYNQDMEMACDERALRDLGRGERLDYSRTLLRTAARGSGLELPVFFGESSAKKRVHNILKKKKKTLAGGLAAAVFICALAVLLFTRAEGKSGGEAEAERYAAGGIVACPFVDVEGGQLKVMLYNFTGWDHMYVNQVDFRVERQEGDGWETVEPDLSVNRISSQPKLLQVRWPRELGGLLAQYEAELEDGEYRLVLYCQDSPVEDPEVEPEEIYAPFSWKDGAPEDEVAMADRKEQIRERYVDTDFPWTVTFVYEQEASSREEEIQRRAEENREIRAGDEALLKLYEEKLGEIEVRMENAAAKQKEAYSDFCIELQGEMARIEWSMNHLEDIWIGGKNVTKARLEYEDEIREKEEELSNLEAFMAVREELQNKLLEEIAAAEEKQELIDHYNQKAEFLQQLHEQQYQLQQTIQRLNQEVSACLIQENAGYDLIETQKQRLERLPSDLSAETAQKYDIPVIFAEGDSSEVRGRLYQFWLETEGSGKLPEGLSPEKLQNGEISLTEEKPDTETIYRTVKSMTFTFGEETEEGGLVVTSVTAWGNGYLILVDQSRDVNEDNAAEDMAVYCYDRLYWLTSPEQDLEMVAASDEQSLTYERFMQNLLSSTWDGRTDRLTIAMF